MKKLSLFILALSLLLCLPVSAYKDGGCLGNVPVVEETITVDAEKDAIYNQALLVDVKYPYAEHPVRATAVVYLLYADDQLFVFAEITDSDMVEPTAEQQQNTPWETDALEVFINDINSNEVLDIIQYRVDNSGWPSVYDRDGLAVYGPDGASEFFRFAEKDTETGYQVELAIPVISEEIGISFQVLDMASNNGESAYAHPYSEATKSGLDWVWTAEQHPYVTVGKTDGSSSVNDSDEVPDDSNDTSADSDSESVSGDAISEVDTTTDSQTVESNSMSNTGTAGDTTTDKETDSKSADDEGGIHPGVIVGIVAAVVVVAAVVLVILKKKKA